MSRKTVLMCVLTILMVGYFCVVPALTFKMSADAKVKGLDVHLTAPSRFVQQADILSDCGIDPADVSGCLAKDFDLNALEKYLKASDKLQDANVTLLTDGTVRIDVTPMIPVARVFDPREPSYYINVEGKRISAQLRYHLDVPVLVGIFDSVHPASRLLPLLDYIASNERIGSMVATVTQERNGNIIIVPTIVGHVVNFGDTSMVVDKFQRLRAFYRHVSPTKGWMAYDTISVKWRGQIVATRRDKGMAPGVVASDEEQTGILDIDNNEPLYGDSLRHI